MLWPVFVAQSTNFLRSLNSPTPKLVSLRREKTGIAVPAPRQGLVSNSGMTSLISSIRPLAGTSAKKWLEPDSQTFEAFVLVSKTTNLYSKGSFTLRETLQNGAEVGLNCTNFFQSSNILPLPVMASISSLRIRAHGTVKVTLPARLNEADFLLNITSAKALVQKGESSGRSCHRSRISRDAVAGPVEATVPSTSSGTDVTMVGEPCRTTGTVCLPHSRRTLCPSRRSSNEYSSVPEVSGTSKDASQRPPAKYFIAIDLLPERIRNSSSPGEVKYSRDMLSRIVKSNDGICPPTEVQY